MERIENYNELPMATLDDMIAGKVFVRCGEDHPWGCKRLEVVKVVAEQGNLVVVQYHYVATDQPICELVGQPEA